MTDNFPILYVKEETFRWADRPEYRTATVEEIGQVARQFEGIFRSLLRDECTPIPVVVTYAGRNKVHTELHSRRTCEHVWERGEPRVHMDTTRPVYIIGSVLDRGPLEEEE